MIRWFHTSRKYCGGNPNGVGSYKDTIQKSIIQQLSSSLSSGWHNRKSSSIISQQQQQQQRQYHDSQTIIETKKELLRKYYNNNNNNNNNATTGIGQQSFSSNSSSGSDSNLKKWKEKARKECERQGKELDDLTRRTMDGLILDPIYYNNDDDDGEMAGVYPYTRGPYATMYTMKPWTIRQYGGFSTAKESNEFYKRALKNGQQGLSVAFDLPTHRGYDSDDGDRVMGDVGMAGVPIDSILDMKLLFQDIPLDTISVSMTMNGAVLPILAMYIQTAIEQQQEQHHPSNNHHSEKEVISKLRGTIQNDILKEFMVRNTFIYPPQPSIERVVADIMGYCSMHMPRFHSISISGYHLQEAGADAALELAFTLANGLTYLETAQRAGLDIDKISPSFFFAIGMDYYTEIAKLRAARRLWAQLVQDKFKPKNEKTLLLRTHCQTSGYSLTEQQPMNNIIRTTIEAMAAIQGGTQSLHTNSYDEAIGLPTEQTSTIARNTQLILQEETNIPHVVDPWAGSYMMENLTNQMEQRVLSILDEIHESGTMLQYIESGMAKMRIEESATKKQARIDSCQDTIVGVNKYIQNTTTDTDTSQQQQQQKVLQIDNTAVRNEQIERLKELKENRDETKVKEALDHIEASANLGTTCDISSNGNHPHNLLSLCIQAAKVRCTVGEISLAMERAWGRHVPTTSVVQGAYYNKLSNNNDDDEYKHILQQITSFENQYGRRPRILVAKMGQDGHDRGAKVIASGFSDLGFDVDVGPLFQTPKEVAMQAIDADVHVIGVSSQAAGHKTLLPALKKELHDLGASHMIVIAGGVIPKQDYEYLLKGDTKCCDAIFGPGTRIPDATKAVVELIIEKQTT